MKVLMLGDVVGPLGCEAVRALLPQLKKEYEADLVVANGENSASGNGILPFSARHLLDSGVDVITTGNHVFRRREIYDLLEENGPVIRPANYPAATPGVGVYVYDSLRCRAAVVNLMGTAMLEPLRNPFDTVDAVLKELDTRVVLLDFHAEATSEKRAMGFYLDGRVSAVVGTHTHVQTADEQILPKKTAYLTDLGMCGPYRSVLGVKPEAVIRRFRTSLPTRFENADGPACVCGAAIEISEKTGEALAIERISRILG